MNWHRLDFVVTLPPRGQARARSTMLLDKQGNPVRDRKTGRPIILHHKSKEQSQDERKLEALLLEHKPPMPAAGPVRIWINAFMPIPVSKPKRWKAAARSHEIRPTGKPDTDNIIKHLLDIMTGVFWADDKQVCGVMCEKWYGEPARYEISVFSSEPWRMPNGDFAEGFERSQRCDLPASAAL